MPSNRQIEPLNSDLFTSLSIEELEERLSMEELDVRGEAWTCDCEGAVTEGRTAGGGLFPVIMDIAGDCDGFYCKKHCTKDCQSKW